MLHAQSVLFAGNSFTFVPRDVDVGTATELNKDQPGGVPALFQALTEAGGQKPAVTMETVGGKTLAFHYGNKRELLSRPWMSSSSRISALARWSPKTVTAPPSTPSAPTCKN